MIAVDTNVLIRVLVDDPGQPKQVKAARARVKHARQVFVPQIVQAETVWVLESAYRLDKPAILGILAHLLQNKAYTLQNEATFQKAVKAYTSGDADFADYLIHAECEAAAYPLVTFDKRLAKAPKVTLIPDR